MKENEEKKENNKKKKKKETDKRIKIKYNEEVKYETQNIE